MNNNGMSDLLSITEVAAMEKVEYSTALSWVQSGALPAKKIGRTYIVQSADVKDARARYEMLNRPPQMQTYAELNATIRQLQKQLAEMDTRLSALESALA